MLSDYSVCVCSCVCVCVCVRLRTSMLYRASALVLCGVCMRFSARVYVSVCECLRVMRTCVQGGVGGRSAAN